jgi:hypothetical protein
MLAFYSALAVAPFGWEKVAARVERFERRFPVRLFVFLLLWIPGIVSAYARTGDPENPEAIQVGPYETMDAVAYLRENARGETLLARKPHVAFLSGLKFAPLPQVDTPAALHETARHVGARYLLVSRAELALRQAIQPFADPEARIPGFRRVFESPGALLYEVLPDSSAMPGAPAGATPPPSGRP